MSTVSKIIFDQKNKLMKKTNEIKRNIEANKSLIEAARQKKRQEEDDCEIARQVDQIKQKNFNKRTARFNGSAGGNRTGTAGSFGNRMS